MMRYFCAIFILVYSSYYGQTGVTVVVNDKLLTQLAKNHAVRMASEETFFKSYEKQKKLYDDVNKKTAEIIAIQEYIYDQLTNVNSAISQGKTLLYMYKDLEEIAKYTSEMLKLSSSRPQYAVLIGKYYTHIGEQLKKIKIEVAEDIMREDKDYLMDAADREMLIEKVYARVRNIKGNLLYIILRLQVAKKTPYLYQIPVLNNYISQDKVIVSDILEKYKHIVKW